MGLGSVFALFPNVQELIHDITSEIPGLCSQRFSSGLSMGRATLSLSAVLAKLIHNLDS